MARASKWGMPIPASGEVHWGMKGKVGNMKSFRRRSYGPKRNSSWVSYVDDGWVEINAQGAAAVPVLLGQMSAYDSLGGGTQGGSSNYLAIRQKVTIARFQGAIWVTANADDDLSDGTNPFNHMMLNYVWRKQQLDADAAGGTSILTATNQDPSPSTIGDLGRLLRFRDINKWGTINVPCYLPNYAESHGAYQGVTTGAAVLNNAAPLETMPFRQIMPGRMARIPFPRGPIALKEGEGIACIVAPWSARQFSGAFSNNGRGLLYYRQYRALHVVG